MKREKPHVVLIGNSMAGTRIDERTLDRLLAPRRAVALTKGGSRMGVWYSMLKNYVIASGVRPERVIVFCRYTELTDLTLRATMERWQIDNASPERDPVVEGRLVPLPNHPIRRLARRLGEAVPVDRLKDRANEPATRFGYWATARSTEDVDPGELPELVNAPFALENLRASSATVSEEPIPRVADVVDASLLPPMIELAREHGIPLTFVRVRPQSVANGQPESPETQRYVRELGEWIEAHGASFVDMTDATWERAELYGSGDHIAGRYRARYTRLFVKHLPHLFE